MVMARRAYNNLRGEMSSRGFDCWRAESLGEFCAENSALALSDTDKCAFNLGGQSNSNLLSLMT